MLRLFNQHMTSSIERTFHDMQFGMSMNFDAYKRCVEQVVGMHWTDERFQSLFIYIMRGPWFYSRLDAKHIDYLYFLWFILKQMNIVIKLRCKDVRSRNETNRMNLNYVAGLEFIRRYVHKLWNWCNHIGYWFMGCCKGL